MSELNPNHPMTRFAADHWHKFCALLLHKFRIEAVEITIDDLRELEEREGGTNIVVDSRGGRIVLRLVPDEEARRLAMEEGGLPA